MAQKPANIMKEKTSKSTLKKILGDEEGKLGQLSLKLKYEIIRRNKKREFLFLVR